jgi:hypothetical protein
LCCAIHVERQGEIVSGNKAQARRKLTGLMYVLGWADT